MLLKEVQGILELGDLTKKELELERLDFDFVLGRINIEEVTSIINLLIKEALIEKNKELRMLLLSIIINALSHYYGDYHRDEINWNLIVEGLDIFPDDIEEMIEIIGFSGDTKYISVLEKYVCYPEDDIRESAREAIESIKNYQKSKSR
ncbi:hypothetical protein [Laceyella putida]|uniref:Immunity protein 30 domain-containing protein n=1 Tax=Laceyella putida TaxID=110101 RepID=A0ABW2RQE0_9BACL